MLVVERIAGCVLLFGRVIARGELRRGGRVVRFVVALMVGRGSGGALVRGDCRVVVVG